RLVRVEGLERPGQEEHGHRPRGSLDRPADLVPRRSRHRDVDEDEVGPGHREALERLSPRADGVDPDVGVAERQLDDLADRPAAAGMARGVILPGPGWPGVRGVRSDLPQATPASVFAPGVNTSSTPADFSAGMSSSGMIPPPKTAMSDAPRSRRSSITLGKR